MCHRQTGRSKRHGENKKRLRFRREVLQDAPKIGPSDGHIDETVFGAIGRSSHRRRPQSGRTERHQHRGVYVFGHQ